MGGRGGKGAQEATTRNGLAEAGESEEEALRAQEAGREMNRLPLWAYKAAAAALLLAGVFLAARAYRPAESGMITDRNLFLGTKPESWSRGASIDPTLATEAAGCLVGSFFLFRQRGG